jgi:hypothetical protein
MFYVKILPPATVVSTLFILLSELLKLEKISQLLLQIHEDVFNVGEFYLPYADLTKINR